jgi:hypothetical protein
LHGAVKKLADHIIDHAALFAVQFAKRATVKMDPKLSRFAETQPPDRFFFDQESGLFAVV